MGTLTIIALLLALVGRIPGTSAETSTCNTTLFKEWENKEYFGALRNDVKFWLYQAETQFKLPNKLALSLSRSACAKQFDLLYFYLAGRMGPIDIQHSYKTMCRLECIESDFIHQAALLASGCSCLELSTQPSDSSYHILGDFCSANTARLLCDRVGYCGVWGCRIDDFMCPRYEWDKKVVPFKGAGSCERGSAVRFSSLNLGILVAVGAVFLFNLVA